MQKGNYTLFAWFSLTCSSTQNVHFQKVHAILMKKLCNVKVCYLVAYGCKNVNCSENGRFRYKITSKTQPEMEFLEVASFIYLFSQKVWSSSRLQPKFNSSTHYRYFMCSSKFFLKNPTFCTFNGTCIDSGSLCSLCSSLFVYMFELEALYGTRVTPGPFISRQNTGCDVVRWTMYVGIVCDTSYLRNCPVPVVVH